jgi:2-methylcitrate dehydratase PrpD
MSTPLDRLSGWAARLSDEDIPARVRELAASQLLSQLAAIRVGARHPLGRKLIAAFGRPLQPDRKASACVLAGLGSWLNLADTAYAGHLSGSTVAVPLAFTHDAGLGGARLITAVVAANECAARITAAATLGPLRGQSAVHTHLAGGVAGRLASTGAPARQWADAFGIALAMPNWPLMRAFLDSDARLLNTLTPVRTAMDACDAAEAGLHGAPDLLEHPDGFLARFASVPLAAEVHDGLGERWHTETLSFKMRPGGPGIDAAVDCAIELHRDLKALPEQRNSEIVEVCVAASRYTLLAQRSADAHLAGPDSTLGALVLDVRYPVASALLTGGLTVADLEPPRLRDPVRWRLAERVQLVHDPAMTVELFGSDAPFGAAVRRAGPAAEPWLRGIGGEEMVAAAAAAGPGSGGDFATATKATPARVTVRLANGTTLSRERSIPLGAAGPHTAAHHRDLVLAKFLAAGGSADVGDAAKRLDDMGPAELTEWITAAL